MIIFSKGWSYEADGPGQRLVYYLKGCNMRCRWCASPESLNSQKEILFYPERSSHNIDYVCPHNAIDNKRIKRERCLTCTSFDCAEKWRNTCFELVGTNIFPAEIVTQAIAGRDFFGDTGGITFGGGEATLQAKDVIKTLKLLRKNGIHTSIETNASTETFREIAETVDLLICDFKVFDNSIHQNMTGIANDKILANLYYAVKTKDELCLRIPLVPGLNDSEKEMLNMANFLSDAVLDRKIPLKLEILRMHHIGAPKYKALGKEYLMKNVSEPSYELAEAFLKKLNHDKIQATIGG